MGKDRPGGDAEVALRLTAERPDAPRLLYGRTRGKTLRRQQSELLESRLPALAVDPTAAIPDIGALFPRPVKAVRVEIGFGGGEHLIAEAAAAPDVGFIGCEPFLNGVAKAVSGLEERGLDNVRLFHGEATEILARLPDASLDRVSLLYPDPWPKRRHRKRRFVADERLALLARVLGDCAVLRFATDIDDYAGWTLARVLRSADFAWTVAAAADWQKPWPGWTGTRYEAKALAAGRRPVYLTFVRKPRAPAPPVPAPSSAG